MARLLGAAPVIFSQIWQFDFPALPEDEVQRVIPVTIASSLLFFGGVTFGYAIIFRYLFPFALEVTADNVTAVLSINSYLGTSTKLLLAFGMVFNYQLLSSS